MKYIWIFLISLISTTINAQDLTDREVEKFSKLEVQISTPEYNDIRLTNHFRQILLAEKQRKSKKRSGIIFTSLSIVSIGYGFVVSSAPSDTFWHENPQSGLVGGMLIGAGLLKGVIGVPMLFTSNKRKKQRDKLIREYREDLK